MTRTARTTASTAANTADQADATGTTGTTTADQAATGSATPAAPDLKAMLAQAVLQLTEKRAALLKGRAELVDRRLQLLSKPVGADDIKRLAFAPIDQRANDFTNRAGWRGLLSGYAFPSGERPDLGSYQGAAGFTRSATETGRRRPLCVGDMLTLRTGDEEAITPREANNLAGLGRSDFGAGLLHLQADNSRDRYPQGGEPTITRPRAEYDSTQHLTGLICFLVGDILKQRIADFIDSNLTGSEASAAVNWPEVERQLVDLNERIAAFDHELTQVDTELADLPVACAECNEARYRLGRPMLDQAASLAAAAAHA